MDAQKDYKDLWNTVKFLLTLSHSQATVERGFSINKEVLTPNLKKVSLTAMHLIHDTISTQQVEVANFDITEELFKSCSPASNR